MTSSAAFSSSVAILERRMALLGSRGADAAETQPGAFADHDEAGDSRSLLLAGTTISLTAAFAGSARPRLDSEGARAIVAGETEPLMPRPATAPASRPASAPLPAPPPRAAASKR